MQGLSGPPQDPLTAGIISLMLRSPRSVDRPPRPRQARENRVMAGMKRKIIVSVIVADLLLPYAREAWAHDGGLDRHGCHNVTATGEYHCHRGEDDEDKTTALLVAAGVVVVLVAATLVLAQQEEGALGHAGGRDGALAQSFDPYAAHGNRLGRRGRNQGRVEDQLLRWQAAPSAILRKRRRRKLTGDDCPASRSLRKY